MTAKWYIAAMTLLFSSLHAIEVQGHRGSRGTRPENTLPAFEEAVEAGVDVLELDLLVSKDGVVFIHHDFFTSPELCSCENRELISSWTMEQIKAIDCGSKTNPEFPGQTLIPGTQIPTLQELFDAIRAMPHPHAQKVRLNLELKRHPGHPEYTLPAQEFAEAVVRVVKENGFSDRVYYSSFDPEILSCIGSLDRKAIMGFIFAQPSLDYLESRFPGSARDTLSFLLSYLGVQIVSPEYSLMSSVEEVQYFQKMGLRVIPWTPNNQEKWEGLLALGVDGLITDYPVQLMNFLESHKQINL